MIAPFLFFAMYCASFLPLLLLTFIRVGKAEIWALTCLTLVWLGGVALFYSLLFKAGVGSVALPWTLAGVCGGICIFWAILLSCFKEEPIQPPQTTTGISDPDRD